MRKNILKVLETATEFIQDWKKGDFKLCKLAECDASSLEKALQDYYNAQKEVKIKMGEYVLEQIIQSRLCKVYPVENGNAVFIWSSGATEQIEAIIDNYFEKARE